MTWTFDIFLGSMINSIISYKVFHTFLLHFYIFLVNISISAPQWLPVTRRFGTRSTELKDSVPRTKDRGELGYILRIPHLSRRSWQVVLRMSTTPSVLSCLHRMEVAMKQPVRPIPALRKRKKVGWEEEKMDGLAYWLVNFVNVKSSVGTSDTRGLDDEKNTHTFTANITNKAFVPAVNNCRPAGGRSFFSGPLHLLHQLQKGRSLIWCLLIGPRGVPVLPQTALLSPTLVHNIDTQTTHRGLGKKKKELASSIPLLRTL